MSVAYGFVQIEDLFSQRVQQVGPARIWDAIDESAAEHNRVLDELMAAFVTKVTHAQEQYELPGGGSLQPLTPDGNPIPAKPSGSYQVGFPIFGGGTAWGTNRVTRELITVQETNRLTVDAQQKDVNWLRRHLLAAILDDQSWVFNDKTGPDGTKGLGNITIQPLANGDSVQYVLTGGEMSGVHDHYLAQANAIDDSNNPFPTIYTHLQEHPSNAPPFVAYVATNLVTSIKGLANFIKVPDPDEVLGSGVTTLSETISRGFGETVHGKVDGVWIVEWGVLPDGYMIAHSRGGGEVLAMREYPVDSLQGFYREPFNEDGNHQGTRMIRWAGFGVRNRVAAVVYQIGNATYQVPASYDAPLSA